MSETRIGRTPSQAGSATAWAAVACGYDFGLAREEVRHPLSLGFNGNGELGRGGAKERHTSTEVDSGMCTSVVRDRFTTTALPPIRQV